MSVVEPMLLDKGLPVGMTLGSKSRGREVRAHLADEVSQSLGEDMYASQRDR